MIFQAIDQLENCRLANEEEEKSMEKKCVPLYLNASLAALRFGNWKTAAQFSRKVLHLLLLFLFNLIQHPNSNRLTQMVYNSVLIHI